MGIWILVAGASPLVSIPPTAMALLASRASRWSAEVVANESALLEELRPLDVVRITGPAFIGYGTAQTLDLSREAEARAVTSADRVAVESLRAACSHEDWAHGGSEHEKVPTFGCFDVNSELCSLAGYKIWDATIAHLAVVSAPGQRGHGFATAAVAAAARHALSASLIPQYRTLLSNAPSMRIAARLGFESYGFSVYVRLAGLGAGHG